MKSYSSPILVALFIILIVNNSFGQEDQRQRQFLTFFSQLDCPDEASLGKISASATLPNTTVEKSVSLFINGMWSLIEYRFSTGEGSNTTTFISNKGSCFNLKSSLRGESVMANRFGDENQNEPTLYFYTTSDFKGLAYRVNEDGLTFRRGIKISSWFFTGDHKWAIFEGQNDTGKMTCLTPLDTVASKQYGFTWSVNSNIQAGSVRYANECVNNSGSSGMGVFHFYGILIISFYLCLSC